MLNIGCGEYCCGGPLDLEEIGGEKSSEIQNGTFFVISERYRWFGKRLYSDFLLRNYSTPVLSWLRIKWYNFDAKYEKMKWSHTISV